MMGGHYDDDGSRPDVAQVIARVTEGFRRNLGRFGPIIFLLILLAILATGVYEVGPGEQGVVRTFGKETDKKSMGLHFRIPLVQLVDVVNVERIRRIELGYRGDERIKSEAQMLTGDANIVEAQMTIQYRVTDTSKYLFELKDPEETLRAAAEVALRSMVGRTKIDDLMTTGRERVQEETRAWLQKLIDDYQSGLSITEVKLQAVDAPDEVKEAFHDVVRAREEKERLINEARGYQADLIPRAKGEAQKIEFAAQAYKEQRVREANGDHDRFLEMLAEYGVGQRVTRERLHLETLERIMSKVEKKIIVDGTLAKGALPLLPLDGARAVGAVAAPGGK